MMMQQLRFPLDTPEDHARALHPDGLGKVTLAVRQGGRWLQSYHPIADLPYIVRVMEGRADVYLSQNRFWGPRRITHLAQLDALYADLDYYTRPELRDLRPWQVAELALQALEAERIPAPSFFVASGRGVALVWLHTPVPRAALPRWNACQRRIYEALRHLGADARARDAARVLRLIGSRHGETGAIVEALTPAGPPWPFDTLADEILPVPRAELARLYDIRVQRASRRPRACYRPEAYTDATLWEARLADLQTLLQLRWFGCLPPGHRDNWLFLAGVAMSWLAIPLVLQRELYALAHQVGGWSEAEARSRLQAVLARAHMAARGETVTWNGVKVDARYRFETDTIIEWLEITPEEQRQLRTLWGPELRQEKERARWHRRQSAAGRGTGLDRAAYLDQVTATDKREEARRLRANGASLTEIARHLGVSKQRVQQYLK